MIHPSDMSHEDIILSCAQNCGTVRQLISNIWTYEISRDLDFSMGFSHMADPSVTKITLNTILLIFRFHWNLLQIPCYSIPIDSFGIIAYIGIRMHISLHPKVLYDIYNYSPMPYFTIRFGSICLFQYAISLVYRPGADIHRGNI